MCKHVENVALAQSCLQSYCSPMQVAYSECEYVSFLNHNALPLSILAELEVTCCTQESTCCGALPCFEAVIVANQQPRMHNSVPRSCSGVTASCPCLLPLSNPKCDSSLPAAANVGHVAHMKRQHAKLEMHEQAAVQVSPSAHTF